MKTGFRLGSLAQDAPDGIKILIGALTAAGKFCSLEFPLEVDYQVPAGKTFYITGLLLTGGAINAGCQFGYGDDAVGEGDVAPTNAVPISKPIVNPIANDSRYFSFFAPVPAQKFPYIWGVGGASSINVFGIEI